MDRIAETKTFVVSGASGHGIQEREENDFYATSPLALRCLFKFLEEKNIQLSNSVLEPACGMGHLSEKLKEHYATVVSTDLIDRGYGASGIDFLKSTKFEENGNILEAKQDFDIVTNPPYKHATEFVKHSLDVLQPGKICAMYLKLIFLEGISRYKNIFKTNKPKYVLVLPARIGCSKNGNFKGVDKYGDPIDGTAIAFAWFVWINGEHDTTTIEWFDPDKR